MKFKFIEVLRSGQCHHSCVVGAWRQLAEIDTMSFADEELDTPNARTCQGFGDGFGLSLCFGKMLGLHGQGLKTFAIISTLLYMPDGRTEKRIPIVLCQGEKGDFVIEMDELFNDKLLNVATTAGDAIVKCVPQIIGRFHQTLSLTARTHQRLNDTGVTQIFSPLAQFLISRSIVVASCL